MRLLLLAAACLAWGGLAVSPQNKRQSRLEARAGWGGPSGVLVPNVVGPAQLPDGSLSTAASSPFDDETPKVNQAELLRIVPTSFLSCNGPYLVSEKTTGRSFADISVESSTNTNLSTTWEVIVTDASGHIPITRSSHVENSATQEWEVSVHDNNGTDLYKYAYHRFNPALGAQRINVTDSQGSIVAFIEYVSRSELRIFTCLDSESSILTEGVLPTNSSNSTSFLQYSSSKGRRVLRRAVQEPPSPEAATAEERKGPAFRGPCEDPVETARLVKSWGDAASHAWTLQRFAPNSTVDEARFSTRARKFSKQQYDVVLLLELAGLVSHNQAPWCIAVASAYAVVLMAILLVAGVAIARSCWGPSDKGPKKRRKGKKKGGASKKQKKKQDMGQADAPPIDDLTNSAVP
jgi:hypothetical protein